MTIIEGLGFKGASVQDFPKILAIHLAENRYPEVKVDVVRQRNGTPLGYAIAGTSWLFYNLFSTWAMSEEQPLSTLGLCGPYDSIYYPYCREHMSTDSPYTLHHSYSQRTSLPAWLRPPQNEAAVQ